MADDVSDDDDHVDKPDYRKTFAWMAFADTISGRIFQSDHWIFDENELFKDAGGAGLSESFLS